MMARKRHAILGCEEVITEGHATFMLRCYCWSASVSVARLLAGDL